MCIKSNWKDVYQNINGFDDEDVNFLILSSSLLIFANFLSHTYKISKRKNPFLKMWFDKY
jgi:hypothetical protein